MRTYRALSSSMARFFSTAPYAGPPKFKILQALASRAVRSGLSSVLPPSKVLITGPTHVLEVNGAMAQILQSLGYEQYYRPASHSTSPAVLEWVKQTLKIDVHPTTIHDKYGHGFETATKDNESMWQEVLKKIQKRGIERLVLFGGHFITQTPVRELQALGCTPVGVLHTTREYTAVNESDVNFPQLLPAMSAAKILFEPKLIATAILARARELIPVFDEQMDHAVIGLGAIGTAVVQELLDQGKRVFAFDQNPEKYKPFQSNPNFYVSTLLDILVKGPVRSVISCTGTDITAKLQPSSITDSNNPKYLMSGSSGNGEYETLLQAIQRQIGGPRDPFSEITHKKITIVRGGYSVNHGPATWNVPAKDIELTYALMLVSILNAATLDVTQIPENSRFFRTDSATQQLLVKLWRRNQPRGRYSEELFRRFIDDPNFVRSNSVGSPLNNPPIDRCFAARRFRSGFPNPSPAGSALISPIP